MVEKIQIRRTYKYRMCRGSRNKRLYQTIDIAGIIWNHCVAFQRRYYRLTGKYLSIGRLKSHIARLRKHTRRYGYWKMVNSQSVQDIIERLDRAYGRFFEKKGGIPSFKKVKKYRSFTLKQSGWKLLGGNKIRLLGRTYKFVKHREMSGTIKTVTVKRDAANRLWICFSVIEEIQISRASTGTLRGSNFVRLKSAKLTPCVGGFDFGLKTFLTDDEGRPTTSPEFFKNNRNRIAKRNRVLARKQDGSRNRHRAKRQLAVAHINIADKRRDHHFQLAHDLCDEYDIMFFEDLNLDGMKRLWGRKVSDLGFGQFIEILQYVASMRGKEVRFIDRFEPTSQTCSGCRHRQKLELRERIFDCSNCGLVINRDHNAAINIKRVGISTLCLEVVRRSSERCLV